jgi:hypothetical protein
MMIGAGLFRAFEWITAITPGGKAESVESD